MTVLRKKPADKGFIVECLVRQRAAEDDFMEVRYEEKPSKCNYQVSYIIALCMYIVMLSFNSYLTRKNGFKNLIQQFMEQQCINFDCTTTFCLNAQFHVFIISKYLQICIPIICK